MKMEETMNSRRDFIKKVLSLATLPAILALSSTSLAQTKKKKADKAADGGDGFAIEGQGMPATVKYTKDKSKVAAGDRTTKQNVPFEKQSCNNCLLYDNGKGCGKASAPCTLFMAEKNKLVPADAWCSSWALNANCKS